MEASKLNHSKATFIWSNLEDATKEETISQVKNILKENHLALASIWEYTNPLLQREKYFEFLQEFNDKNVFEDFWRNTDEQVKSDVLIPTIQHLKGKREIQLAIWKETSTEIKNEKFEELLKIDDERMPIADMWRDMHVNLQKEKMPIVISRFRDDFSKLQAVWKKTDKGLQISEFYSVCEQVKTQTYYGEFVRNFLGEVELDENNLPIIPDEIKNIVFDPKNVSRLSGEQQTELLKKLPTIIKSWPSVKENIQLKRANNIKTGSLEVRTNIQEILTAVDLLNRPRPKNSSAEELMEVPGAEKLGVDTLYVASPSTAAQRAYDLAKKMDEAPLVKKFPDISVEDKETGISLSLLNPRDKSAILLGYETHCCFRPNGNADNSAKNPESLLQYCTTTPYGGVIKVGKKNEFGLFDEVYMGTPILASGNCLMFHSYETENKQNSDTVNKLLVEAAKKAIETSNGGIKVVMMTDLYTGQGRLNAENLITIPSTFKQYADGEYSGYGNMYTNLEGNNCILAAKVGDKILYGEELQAWYKVECKENPEAFKEKVGVSLGEISTDYTYPKMNLARRERTIADKEVVNTFEREYQKLREERAILARAVQKAKLEAIENPTDLQVKELSELTAKLTEIDKREGSNYSGMTISEVKNRLKENNERSFRVYSGDDIGLLMQAHGISETQMEVWITERVESEFASKEASSQGKKAKNGMLQREKGKLISEIKRSGESELVTDILPQVINGTITKEGLSVLEAYGIDTAGYEKASVSTRDEKSSAEIIEMQKKQRVSKAMKDENLREEILAEKLFPEISDGEIEERIDGKTKLTLKNKLSDVITRKIIEKAGARDGTQAQERQLTEREKEKREEEIRKTMKNFDGLMISIRDNNISEEQVQELTEIRDTYGIDLEELRQEFAEQRVAIIDELRKEGVKKQKASVSIGLEERARIERIVDRIEPENSEKKYDRIIYGEGWYIGYSQGNVDVCQVKGISCEERANCQKAIEDEIGVLGQDDKSRGTCEQICERYDELYAPTLDCSIIGKLTEDVHVLQKQAVQQAVIADMRRDIQNHERGGTPRRENIQANGEID